MLKYAKIVNFETKNCDVACGYDIEYYKSIGMTLQEVEKGYDNNWYIQGYAPIETEQSINEKNEFIRKKRENLYKKISDPLKQDYDEALARNEIDANEKKQLWLSSKDKIRSDNPYIKENN